MPELLRLQATNIYCWRGRTMGRTIFNVHKGTLILTDHRLVYAGSGGTDVWRQLGWAGLAFAPEAIANAKSLIDGGKEILGWFQDDLVRADDQTLELGPPESLKDGSIVAPLTELVEFGVVERTWSSYLWIAFVAGGHPQAYAFSDKIHIPGGRVWEQLIIEARAELTGRKPS